MMEALKEAALAIDHDDVPIGAIVVHAGKIIGRAHNQVELLKDPTAHAEMIAITQAASTVNPKELNEATLYSTLEPCIMCSGAAVLARFKIIFYGAADPKAGGCGSVFDLVDDQRLNHQIKVVHGLFAEESKALLQSFFKKLR